MPSAIEAPALATDIQDGHIFVSIAAYNDPEVPATLRAMLFHADRPELLRVGLVWQGDGLGMQPQDLDELAEMWGLPGTLDAQEQAPLPPIALPDGTSITPLELLGGRVRVLQLPAPAARGPCWARYLAQLLWGGEDLYLQLDSHMRFVPAWDSKARTQLASAAERSPRPVLCGYCAGYKLGDAWQDPPSEEAKSVVNCAQCFDSDGLLLIHARELKEDWEQPMPNLFWSGQFSFSSAEVLREVPYDPQLQMLFIGEEILMAVRLFTHGWDLFAPAGHIMFHLWERDYRRVYWKDNRDLFQQLLRDSQRRVHSLLEQPADPAPRSASAGGSAPWPLPGGGVTRPGADVFGLGSRRSVADFEAAAGLHFATRSLGNRALRGGGAAADAGEAAFAEPATPVSSDIVSFVGPLPEPLASFAGKPLTPASAPVNGQPLYTDVGLETTDQPRLALWYSDADSSWVVSEGGVAHGLGQSTSLLLCGRGDTTGPGSVERWHFCDHAAQRYVPLAEVRCVAEDAEGCAVAQLEEADRPVAGPFAAATENFQGWLSMAFGR